MHSAFSIYYKTQVIKLSKRSEMYTKPAKLQVRPMQKIQHENSCEIQGGGPEVIVIVG